VAASRRATAPGGFKGPTEGTSSGHNAILPTFYNAHKFKSHQRWFVIWFGRSVAVKSIFLLFFFLFWLDVVATLFPVVIQPRENEIHTSTTPKTIFAFSIMRLRCIHSVLAILFDRVAFLVFRFYHREYFSTKGCRRHNSSKFCRLLSASTIKTDFAIVAFDARIHSRRTRALGPCEMC
jgi:hypothetical protein